MTAIKPVHSGEILLSEFLEPMNLTQGKLAKHIDVPVNRITSIINETLGISGDTALRLSLAFGTTAEFWINLQEFYGLECTKDEHEYSHINSFAA